MFAKTKLKTEVEIGVVSGRTRLAPAMMPASNAQSGATACEVMLLSSGCKSVVVHARKADEMPSDWGPFVIFRECRKSDLCGNGCAFAAVLAEAHAGECCHNLRVWLQRSRRFRRGSCAAGRLKGILQMPHQ